jgi:hypothetical protein
MKKSDLLLYTASVYDSEKIYYGEAVLKLIHGIFSKTGLGFLPELYQRAFMCYPGLVT